MLHSSDAGVPSATDQLHALRSELHELRRKLHAAEVLGRVIQANAAASAVEHALATTCRELALLYEVPQSAFAMFEPDRLSLRVVAEYCAPGYVSGMGLTIPVAGNPIIQYVMKHLEPMVVQDAQNDPRLGPVREIMRLRGTASLMILPVSVGGQVVGTLGIDSVTQREFRDDELTLAGDIVVAVSQALARAELFNALQRELEERRLAEQRLREQSALLAELSTPLIPVTAHTLVLPLIGSVDQARASQVLETLLSGVSQHQVQLVIIDITGMPLIDTHVADVLLRAARAVSLLGAQTIITGIRPEVAQTMVGLGMNLDTIQTYRSLQQAVAEAIARESRS